MKKTMILETLAAALFAVGQAHADPVSLDTATITATYHVGTTGADIFGYTSTDNSDVYKDNISQLDPSGNFVEFMTGDGLFAFDFSSDGQLLIYANNSPDLSTDYSFNFDFGNTLSMPITGFTLKDTSGVTGTLGLTVGANQNSIALDLNGVTWNTDYTPVITQLDSDPAPANVPEPASLALALAGAAGLGLSRRIRRS